MIRYALVCKACDAEFEAWFRSSSDYDAQVEQGHVQCPVCESSAVAKQIMAPSVRTSKSETAKAPASARDLLHAARTYIAETHDYVGNDFSHEARAMHYGEIEERPIWGDMTPEEGKNLQEEGVGARPLPTALTPPRPKDKSSLN